MLTSFFKYLTTPSGLPQNVAAIVGFVALLLIFVLDVFTGADVQIRLLYVFPLVLIALHCENTKLIMWAVTLALIFQGIVLFTFHDISAMAKIVIVAIVLPSNILIAYLGRLARMNHFALLNSATTDLLTGLHNRRSFEDNTDIEIERQNRYGGIFSLVLLDLDGFKKLNDTRGHKAGDEALKELAGILSSQTRQVDMVGRLGGDEFVILMPNTSLREASAFCHSLSDKISRGMAHAGFYLTASIGSFTFEHAPESSEVAFHEADKAMYEAKENRNGSVVSH